tara:strand:- start:43 stop:732 length:690 start_codon:yes stop_codon:yes gene_type:complete
MNVSKNVVDPPPSPYIDINDLKIHFVKISTHNEIYLMADWGTLLGADEGDDEILATKLEDTLSRRPENSDIYELINSIKMTEELINYYNEESSVASTSSTSVLPPPSVVRDEINGFISDFESKMIKLTSSFTIADLSPGGPPMDEHLADSYERIWRSTFNQLNFSKIQEYIEAIDNHNASTTMGTLDFLDATSKFYLTELPCKMADGTTKNELYDSGALSWDKALELNH